MEKYLSPENIEDYNKKEFWDQAFEQYKSVYDWYGNFTDFKRYFSEYKPHSARWLRKQLPRREAVVYSASGDLLATTTGITTSPASITARPSLPL